MCQGRLRGAMVASTAWSAAQSAEARVAWRPATVREALGAAALATAAAAAAATATSSAWLGSAAASAAVAPSRRDRRGAQRALGRRLGAALSLAALTRAEGAVLRLTEENFAEVLQKGTSALVAFVAPWCHACRSLAVELARAEGVLALDKHAPRVAQCDVSRELVLAARYRVVNAPVVILFPDTRVLAFGLQIIFSGQLFHGNLIAFATSVERLAPPRVHSLMDLESKVGASGSFVAFLRGPGADGALQDLWHMDCLKRHPHAVAIANDSSPEVSERLWRQAGLSWHARSPEEAILFVRSGSSVSRASSAGSANSASSGADSLRSAARFLQPRLDAASSISVGAWREQVDVFCAWCERHTLGPVAVYAARRAASLDHSFEWLLLLFEPSVQEQEGEASAEEAFVSERLFLERFLANARAADSRYTELLPVVVPRGGADVAALQHSFGLSALLLSGADIDNASGAAASVELLACAGACDAQEAGAAATAAAAWPAVLFNTKTRLKYILSGVRAWVPGDEASLRHHTDAVFGGQLRPHMRSAPRAQGGVGTASGAEDLVALDIGPQVIEPVSAGLAEVLLLLYAPWCGHSQNFFVVWQSLVAALADGEAGSDGSALRIVQMDATQNEHPDLPPVTRFPTLLFCAAATSPRLTSPSSLGNGYTGVGLLGGAAGSRPWRRAWAEPHGTPVRCLPYDGSGTLSALLAWIRAHSAQRSLRARVRA